MIDPRIEIEQLNRQSTRYCGSRSVWRDRLAILAGETPIGVEQERIADFDDIPDDNCLSHWWAIVQQHRHATGKLRPGDKLVRLGPHATRIFSDLMDLHEIGGSPSVWRHASNHYESIAFLDHARLFERNRSG